MKKIILASILALFLIVGIGCVAAADSNLNNANVGQSFQSPHPTLGDELSQHPHPTLGDGMFPKIPLFPDPRIHGGSSGNDNLA